MKNASLADWLQHFETLHPVGIDMGLHRVSYVWQKLCQIYSIQKPAKDKVIIVAGTNGKGSACQMLTLLLRAKGQRVGTYTSPHIHHFRERVKIDGVCVPDKRIVDAFNAIEKARGDISISYFEATTLATLLVFSWESVDFSVLEVGLGGRLDAVNIVDADAVLITSIGLDHENFLGSDLSQIALEKAGVSRPNVPLIYAQHSVYKRVVEYAKHNHIQLIANQRDYHYDAETVYFDNESFAIPQRILDLGQHQVSNFSGVLVLLKMLALLPKNYHKVLGDFAVVGRMQVIEKSPTVMLDVAHNEDSAKALSEYLIAQSKDYGNIYAVLGMLSDKAHQATLRVFDGVLDAVFCGSTLGERGLSDRQLAQCIASTLACPIHLCGTLPQALFMAKKQANKEDLIIAFGSFLVVEALTA